MICKHCGWDTDAAVTMSVVADLEDHPVAATCVVSGCMFAEMAATIEALDAEISRLRSRETGFPPLVAKRQGEP